MRDLRIPLPARPPRLRCVKRRARACGQAARHGHRAARGRSRPAAPARRDAAHLPGRNDAHALKSVVADVDRYDWEGDAPLRRPCAQTVIYEMHVRGFTAHPNSGVAPGRRGTYAGVVDKTRT